MDKGEFSTQINLMYRELVKLANAISRHPYFELRRQRPAAAERLHGSEHEEFISFCDVIYGRSESWTLEWMTEFRKDPDGFSDEECRRFKSDLEREAERAQAMLSRLDELQRELEAEPSG